MLASEHAAGVINQLAFLQQKISVTYFQDYINFFKMF